MKYDAFISYRHSDLDMFVAKKIHKGLETFKVPKSVAKIGGKKSIKRVFRDQEELPIGSDLNDNISGALVESEYLLVICSPRIVESYWCKKEIKTFIELHDRNHVLAVLIEGEPNESFPMEILVDEKGNPVEPLAADVRGKNKAEVNKKLKTELLRLAAPILHCTYDDLRQRHKERRMKKLISLVGVIAFIVAALGIGFGIYNARTAAIIQENFKGKQINQSKYLAETAQEVFKDGDRQTAVLIAKEALSGEGRPYVANAERALTEALYTYDTGNLLGNDRQLVHDFAVTEMFSSDDEKYLTVIDSSDYVYVWEIETGEKICRIDPLYNEFNAAKSVEYANVVGKKIIVCDSYEFRSYDFSGKLLNSFEFPSSITNCKDCFVNNYLACEAVDTLLVYDMQAEELVCSFEKENDYMFSSNMSYSKDGSLLAIGLSRNPFAGLFGEDNEVADENGYYSGYVEIFDIKNNQKYEKKVERSDVTGVAFSPDGEYVYAVSEDADELMGLSTPLTMDLFLEKISIKGNEPFLWKTSFTLNRSNAANSIINIKTRKYDDVDEVAISIDNQITLIDALTGEKKATTSFSSTIKEFFLLGNSGYGYVAENNGNIDFVNISQGVHSETYDIKTKMEGLNGIKIVDSRFVIKASNDTRINIISYHEGPNMKVVGDTPAKIGKVETTPNEKYYMVRTGSNKDDLIYSFYDSKTDEIVSTLIYSDVADDSFSLLEPDAEIFVNDDEFILFDDKGHVIVFDVSKGEVTSHEKHDAEYLICLGMDVSPNNKYAVYYDSSKYWIYDIEKAKFVTEKEFDEKVGTFVIKDDGKTGFLMGRNTGLFEFNFETGEKTLVKKEWQFAYSLNLSEKMFLSKDEERLYVCCNDQTVRVMNVSDKQILAEIPFSCYRNLFIAESLDKDKVFLQGDDFLFKVYSISQKDFIYIANEATYLPDTYREYPDSNLLVLRSYNAMYILYGEDYNIKSVIDRGCAYLESENAIITGYTTTLYRFPYASLNELMKQAEEAFPGKELSDWERLKYHID